MPRVVRPVSLHPIPCERSELRPAKILAPIFVATVGHRPPLLQFLRVVSMCGAGKPRETQQGQGRDDRQRIRKTGGAGRTGQRIGRSRGGYRRGSPDGQGPAPNSNHVYRLKHLIYIVHFPCFAIGSLQVIDAFS